MIVFLLACKSKVTLILYDETNNQCNIISAYTYFTLSM